MRLQHAHLDVLRSRLELSGRTLIDVGCGEGAFTRRLAEDAAFVIGVDVSASSVATARARAGRREQYLIGDAEALPLPGRCADVVTFLSSFHHVPIDGLSRALAEARRVLRSGGLVYVQEPLAQGPYYEVVRLVDDEDEVRAAAQRALCDAAQLGLRCEEEFEYEAPVRHRDFGSFRRRVLVADVARTSAFDARGREVEECFYANAQQEPDGWTFASPTRMTLLRRVG